ncbi:unnamed protein product, partial [Discosporangium mesarthrocarpum]
MADSTPLPQSLISDVDLPRVGKRGAPQAFARKLYEILATESRDVIGWNKAGTAFHVRDVDTFSEEILTKYYRHSKFSSFQRQLNLYSFRKIVKGPDAGGYAHVMFRRDRPDDLYHVRRSISGSGRYEPSSSIASTFPSTNGNTSQTRGRQASKRSVAAKGGGMGAAGTGAAGVKGTWAAGASRPHKSAAALRRTGKLGSSRVDGARAGNSQRTAAPYHESQPQQPLLAPEEDLEEPTPLWSDDSDREGYGGAGSQSDSGGESSSAGGYSDEEDGREGGDEAGEDSDGARYPGLSGTASGAGGGIVS